MKKLLSALLLLVLIFTFTACASDIQDTNGDLDFSLATITDEDILTMSFGATSFTSSVKGGGDIETLDSNSENLL